MIRCKNGKFIDSCNLYFVNYYIYKNLVKLGPIRENPLMICFVPFVHRTKRESYLSMKSIPKWQKYDKSFNPDREYTYSHFPLEAYLNMVD